jgi:hypothetical protein
MLSRVAQETLVKSHLPDQIPPGTEIRSLENRYLSWGTDAQMMPTNHPSPPADGADDGLGTVFETIAMVNPVASADGADRRISREDVENPGDPVGPGFGVVIREADDIARRRVDSCVQSRHKARPPGRNVDPNKADWLLPASDRLLGDLIVPAHHDEDLVGERGLTGKRIQAAR